MKLNFIKLFLSFLFLSFGIITNAQRSSAGAKSSIKKETPTSFTISKTDFDHLFAKKAKEIVVAKTNKYLDKSSVLMNSLNGDTKFMKIKLNYFQNAFLMVQVNGEYSTQIFILSDDKSVFYKGKIDNGTVTMTKCNEDDIVSE